mmetsp:Transcript_1172/g.3857  ORF Transcript_1172/g.3857 Transcript_1172/m.3857 type:complete len:259 (-) Transcript_1172:4-780(-)
MLLKLSCDVVSCGCASTAGVSHNAARGAFSTPPTISVSTKTSRELVSAVSAASSASSSTAVAAAPASPPGGHARPPNSASAAIKNSSVVGAIVWGIVRTGGCGTGLVRADVSVCREPCSSPAASSSPPPVFEGPVPGEIGTLALSVCFSPHVSSHALPYFSCSACPSFSAVTRKPLGRPDTTRSTTRYRSRRSPPGIACECENNPVPFRKFCFIICRRTWFGYKDDVGSGSPTRAAATTQRVKRARVSTCEARALVCG